MSRPLIDFGVTAGDYARHRPGFPDAFFAHVQQDGIGTGGQRVLDLGCGTGTLARGFALRGCHATGLDPSPEMLRAAGDLDRAAAVGVTYVQGWAETTPFRNDLFDVVCAGQCWHWFNRARAAHEATRVLRPHGRGLVAYFSYLSDPGTLGARTEALVLRYNPAWPFSGSDGRVPMFAEDLTAAGLEDVQIFEFDLDVPFTHAAWRGRNRACNGVLVLPPEQLAQFDADLAQLLADYPEPLMVRHRIFAIVARKPQR